jgi:hypothetical protein
MPPINDPEREVWTDAKKGLTLFHGTSSFFVDSIKKNGLDPGARTYHLALVDRYAQFCAKAGTFFTIERVKDKPYGAIFLTPLKENATNYARYGGELTQCVVYAYPKILKSVKLSAAEKKEAQEIYRFFLDMMQKNKPVIVHVLASCPALQTYGMFTEGKEYIAEAMGDFELFKQEFGPELRSAAAFFGATWLVEKIRRRLPEAIAKNNIARKFIRKIEFV